MSLYRDSAADSSAADCATGWFTYATVLSCCAVSSATISGSSATVLVFSVVRRLSPTPASARAPTAA